MPNSTHQDQYSTRPNPLGQSFWLVIGMGFVTLLVIGKLGPAVDGATPRFDAQDLIEMADPPALIEAPRVARPDDTATETARQETSDLDAVDRDAVDRDAAENGTAVAGPSASLGNNSAQGDPQLIAGDDAAVAETGSGGPTIEGDQLSDPQSRGDAALESISYPWQQLLPGWTIEFLPEKSGLYGLTLVPEKRIEVYVRDSQPEALLAHVIAHELGHAIDVTLNDGPDRRAWEEARGTGSSPWWPGNGTTDFSTGAGDFAESFAAWQVGSGSFRSTLADPPTDAQIELLARLAAG